MNNSEIDDGCWHKIVLKSDDTKDEVYNWKGAMDDAY